MPARPEPVVRRRPSAAGTFCSVPSWPLDRGWDRSGADVGVAGGHTARGEDDIMGSPLVGDPSTSPRHRRSRVILGGVIALALVVIITIGTFVFEWVVGANWQRPDFPSLAQQPASSLQGTVAYFADQSRCVRV